MSPTALPSLPWYAVLRYVPGLLRNRPETLQKISQRHGGLVRIPLPGRDLFLITDPDAARHILQTRATQYRKSFDFKIVRELLGDGLVTSHDEAWRSARKIALPFFLPEALQKNAGRLMPQIGAFCKTIETRAGTPFPILQPLMELSLDMAAALLFERTLGTERQEILDATAFGFRYIEAQVSRPWDALRFLPTPARRRFREGMARFNAIIDHWIAEEPDPPRSSNLIGILRGAAKDLPAGIDANLWIRDHLKTFLIAGHETTAVSLAWTLHHLAHAPEALCRLHRDVDPVRLKNSITPDQLTSLPFVRMAVQESMRLTPAVWAIGREASTDDKIGPHRIPAGATVIICSYVLHRRPDLWDRPDEFRPERFSSEEDAPRYGSAYLPFSTGPRHCIGAALSLLEIQMVIAEVARRFTWKALSPARLKTEALISLRPRTEILLSFQPRRRQ